MKIVNSASEDIDILGRIQTIEYRLDNGEGGSYSSVVSNNNSLVEQRVSALENKIKKIQSELDKTNISAFEETIQSKISLLEDVVSKTSALPNTVEQRITILENRVEDLENETTDNDVTKTVETTVEPENNSELLQKIEQINKDVNDYIATTNSISS